jgi:uncharacterized membrane protein
MPSWLHLGLLATHISAGIAAIFLGAIAVAVRKGGRLHATAGTAFFASMLVLGVSASVLEPFRTPKPGSPLVGVFVCYFVLTSWVTARRRDGTSGWFEKGAAAVALGTGALMLWGGLGGTTPPSAGRGPVFFFAALCLLAGLLDLRVVLRGRLSAGERIRRHLWRMCFAFFIATGSFFLGQQKVMPHAVRGSPILFVLAFAPFAVMAFWLIRLRFAKAIARLSLRLPSAPFVPPMPALEMDN